MVDNFEELENLYMAWEEFRRLERERDGLVEYNLMEELHNSGDMTFLRDSKLLSELENRFYLDSRRCIKVLCEDFVYDGHIVGFRLNGGNSSARRVFKPESYWKSRSSKAKSDRRRGIYESVRYAVSVETDDNGEPIVDEITDRKKAYRVLENLVKPGYVVFVGTEDVPSEEEGLMEFFEGSEENLEEIYENWGEFENLTKEFIVMSCGYKPKDCDYNSVDLHVNRDICEDELLDRLLMYEYLDDRFLDNYMRERLK